MFVPLYGSIRNPESSDLKSIHPVAALAPFPGSEFMYLSRVGAEFICLVIVCIFTNIEKMLTITIGFM